MKNILFLLGILLVVMIYLMFTTTGKPKKVVIMPKEIKKDTLQVTVTTYNIKVNQTDITPNITACGFKIKEKNIFKQRSIAISRDLFKKLNIKMNDTIELVEPFEFNGKWIVRDVMNKRFSNYIDILLPTSQIGGKFKGIIKLKNN